MVKIIAIVNCLLFVFVSAHNIAPIRQTHPTENLKLANYTGSLITPSMITFYIKTINDAFTFYQEDLPNNTLYIQNKLEGAYAGYVDVIILK
jgi:hypothetical protein